MTLNNFIIDTAIVWDRVSKSIFEKPQAKPGRVLRVQVTNAGVIEDLTGYTLKLGWINPVTGIDGLDAFEVVDATKGIFELPYTTGMLSNFGSLRASLLLVNVSEETIAESNDFVIRVTASPFNQDASQSVGSWTALAEILLNEDARVQNEAGRVQAEINRAATFEALVDSEMIAQNVETKLTEKEATFAPRMLSLEEQLEQVETTKADMSYVDTITQNIASGSPKGVYATLALLQAAYPTGNTNVYVVSADGNWYYWSGSAWVSGGAYLSEVSVATNFEMHKQTDGVLDLIRGVDLTWTEGQVLVASTGATSTSGAYNASLHGVTGFFNVSGYTHISALILRNYGLDIAALVFYDALNAIISSYTQNNTQDDIFRLVPIPVGAVKAKYSYYADARADALVRARFSYLKNVNTDSLRQKQDVALADIEALKNKYVSTDNMFDKSAITAGRELQPYNIVDNVEYGYTDFIAVTTGETLYAMGCSVSSSVGYIYDSSFTKLNYKVFNFTANNANLISELNVAYVRFNVKTSDLATFFLRKQKVVRYEPYKQLPFNEIKNFNNGQLNFWQDKNGDSLGDSLTGQGFYQKYVRQYFNLAKFSNHGIGGTKLSGPSNEFGASMWEDSRINALDADADVLALMGGANDGEVEIGELSLANYDTNTYAGALNVILSKLQYKYQKLSVGYYAGINYAGVTQVTTAKNIMIFLCTPFYMPSETNPNRTKVLANAVREIAKLWGYPVMDIAGKSMLNDGVKDVYWGTDRTHPLEPAYRDRIAPVMIGEMEKFKPVDYTKAYYI